MLESITTTETSEQQNSLKISKNAKGDYAMDSKIYNDNPEKLETEMRAQLEMARKLIQEQKKKD